MTKINEKEAGNGPLKKTFQLKIWLKNGFYFWGI